MKKLRKFFPLFLILLFGIVYLLQRTGESKTDESFRNITKIEYTSHAKCRMGCRYIDEKEIKEIISGGILNREKSGFDKKYNDETFALEGYSHENQHIRVVLTPRNGRLLIITVIDLDRDWECDCN